MTRENDRLNEMLKDKKISETEYQQLLNAMNKKVSGTTRFMQLALNPFKTIVGLNALLLGLGIMVLMSYFGVIAKMYFPGILAMLNANIVIGTHFPFGFTVLLLQNLITYLVLSSLFIVTAVLFRQKGIRYLDVFGAVALSRYPYLLLTMIFAAVRVLHPSSLDVDLSKGFPAQPSLLILIFTAVSVIFICWQIAVYYFAMKESSGMTGKKLMIGFIASMIVADVLTWYLTTCWI